MFCDDVVFFFHWDYLACAHLRAFTPVSANMCRMGVRNVFSASVATEKGELQEQKLKSNHLAQFVKLLTAINSTPWILKFRWLPLQIIVRFLRIQKSKQNDAKLNHKSLPMEVQKMIRDTKRIVIYLYRNTMMSSITKCKIEPEGTLNGHSVKLLSSSLSKTSATNHWT